MENQHNNNISEQLAQFRVRIDAIDHKIIDLLNDRMAIVQEVGKHKQEAGDKFFIRSNREADMIKSLIEKASDSIPKSVIVAIWRKIITSANCLEQTIKLAIHNPQKLVNYHYLVREYYGDFMPIVDYSSSTNIISEIEKGNVQIGAFSLPEIVHSKGSDYWWINMANSKNGLKVFAKIPFVEYEQDKNMHKDQLLVVTMKDAEKSKDDTTLLVVELSDETSSHSLQKILSTSSLNAKIINSAKINEIRNFTFYLIEAKGFYTQQDKEIQELISNKIKPHVSVIGNYPNPIQI